MEGSDGVLGQVEGGEGAGKLAVDRGQVRSLVVHYVFIFITDGVSDLDEDSLITTLQSMMNLKLSKQRFRHCYENGLFKTIQTIPNNLHVSVKLTSLYCGLRLILVYPNPQ